MAVSGRPLTDHPVLRQKFAEKRLRVTGPQVPRSGKFEYYCPGNFREIFKNRLALCAASALMLNAFRFLEFRSHCIRDGMQSFIKFFLTHAKNLKIRTPVLCREQAIAHDVRTSRRDRRRIEVLRGPRARGRPVPSTCQNEPRITDIHGCPAHDVNRPGPAKRQIAQRVERPSQQSVA